MSIQHVHCQSEFLPLTSLGIYILEKTGFASQQSMSYKKGFNVFLCQWQILSNFRLACVK